MEQPKLVSGIPNLFALYPQIQDTISSLTLLVCMLLWMPYNIEKDKGFTFSLAMAIFWISDSFTIIGCILTLITICRKSKKLQLAAMLFLFVGLFTCIIAGALDSDQWCTAYFSISNAIMDECVAYIIFMYCLFIPFCILYVILLILYRSHYTFSNLIFMRSKRIIYLMFVGALMFVPVGISLKWYFELIDFEWKAYWISIVCFDIFTWIIAFIYGFQSPPIKKTNGFNIYHPLCIGGVAVFWIVTFVSTLLWGLIGYASYRHDTDDLLARYADYILMVSLNLWIIGEVLSEDEGYVDILSASYQSVPQADSNQYSNQYAEQLPDDVLL